MYGNGNAMYELTTIDHQKLLHIFAKYSRSAFQFAEMYHMLLCKLG